MLFGFFRWVRRKIALLLTIAALAVAIKCAYPEFGERVGRWISGAADSRVAQAISSMVSVLSDGGKVEEALEVFREAVQS